MGRQRLEVGIVDRHWETVVREDPRLNTQVLKWYLEKGVEWILAGQDLRQPFVAELNGDYTQPIASTSTIQQLRTADGEVLITKTFNTNHNPFYVRSSVAQALMLATEQSLAHQQFDHEQSDFYRGIYVMRPGEGQQVHLHPYRIGETLSEHEKVMSLMKEASGRTLALEMYGHRIPPEKLTDIYIDLLHRSMATRTEMPRELAAQYGSLEYIYKRVMEHTPGQLSRGEMTPARAYEYLQGRAGEYVHYALAVLKHDSEMRACLLSDEMCRWSGDTRPANTMLFKNTDAIEVVIDPIALLTDPDIWGGTGVDIVPWGQSSALYTIAFLFPDLIGTDQTFVINALIAEYGRVYDPRFVGKRWEDVEYPEIRALQFWVAMKQIEMAGLSTFNLLDTRLVGDERTYLGHVVVTYSEDAVGLIKALAEGESYV